jgi:hypothetical protein
MPLPDLTARRLHNQLFSDHRLPAAESVVGWMVAMQAQDYFGALWAVGLRYKKSSLAEVENAFQDGRILRTHLMRPTWHFVTPTDIRWLLKLTTPRVHQANGSMYRKVGLDASCFAKANRIIGKALEGGKYLTREEIGEALGEKGIDASGLKLTYIVMQAELERILCSGPRRDKQYTYGLLDERAPSKDEPFNREEVLAQCALRYFMSRGPATIRDLAYWSGLTHKDAEAGLQAVKRQLASVELDGQTYWYSELTGAARKPAPTAFLLPNYDEFGMSYKDKGAAFPSVAKEPLFDYSFSHPLMINGELAGSWRRERTKDGIYVHLRPLRPFSARELGLLRKAAAQYESFLGAPVHIV